MTALPTADRPAVSAAPAGSQDYVSMTIAGQLFGIPVLKVQDVLGPLRLTRVPLAPPEVAGNLNLRGRIVTAIDLRLRLGLPPREKDAGWMSVVIEHQGELYSLIVDSVGEVLSLDSSTYERELPTLDPRWRDFAAGIYRLNGALLIVLEVAHLLTFNKAEAA
jgi:purine-binding chemotaxis protein CheW